MCPSILALGQSPLHNQTSKYALAARLFQNINEFCHPDVALINRSLTLKSHLTVRQSHADQAHSIAQNTS
jgi:hypothetical protein